MNDAQRLVDLKRYEQLKRDCALVFYKPYEKQKEFHGHGAAKRERCNLSGNQLGKTLSAGAETAIHLTGEYPDWWTGKRFNKPIRGWVAGVTGETTRDNPQRILMGPLGHFGEGMIPKACLGKISLARGTPDAVENVLVKHKTGGFSQVTFKSYADGREKWQGESLELVWYDEEPPLDIYVEGLTRTNATDGMVYLTLTPLLGMSQVVRRFYPDQGHPDRGLVMMTIEDVGHYSTDQKRKIIEGYLPHERDARVKGIPMLGEGAVYQVAEELIAEDPIQAPAWWPRLIAMDFGWHDHPTAAVKAVWDRDNDCVHITGIYKQSKQPLVVYAAGMKAMGADKIPVSWPHDGLQHDKSSGIQIAQLYRDQGLRMLSEHAQFPDDRKNGTEAAIWEALARMQTNRLKVDRNLHQWFEEFRSYHRKDGKVVAEFDDLMKATHYLLMMLRYAQADEDAPQRQDRYTRRRANRATTWMAA
jgi:phage terminase large subunit-like protein